MSDTNHGGAAFPSIDGLSHDRHTDRDYVTYGSEGMSLRDYFAAAALQGAAASNCHYRSHQSAAEDAYRMADAMIAERAK